MVPYAKVVSVAWLTDEIGPMPWDRLLSVPAIGLSFELFSNNAFFARRGDGAARRDGGAFVTLATGQRAEALWDLTDESVVERIRTDLLAMFPDASVVLKRASTRLLRWYGLPRFRKGWLGRQALLRQPYGRIHFCGDYTAQPGTPGAVGSGYHAAKTVRALLG
jgi:predicted NAD/FAD-dependent oxidoreductase